MEDSRTSVRVRGIAVPPLLLTLIEEGRRRHPGEIALAHMMPWFEDPLHFLPDVQAMARGSKSLDFLTDDDPSAQLFRKTRGIGRAEPIELPLLDVDKALLIAVNE